MILCLRSCPTLKLRLLERDLADNMGLAKTQVLWTHTPWKWEVPYLDHYYKATFFLLTKEKRNCRSRLQVPLGAFAEEMITGLLFVCLFVFFAFFAPLKRVYPDCLERMAPLKSWANNTSCLPAIVHTFLCRERQLCGGCFSKQL